MKHASLAFALCLSMPFASLATASASDDIGKEIGRELAEARKEVRAELAQARAELKTGNLEVGDGLRLGKDKERKQAKDPSLPKAEITPQGDFLIDGKAVDIDARQRSELLAYRGLVVDIALAGIDIGERSAQAAIDAVDRGLFGLMFSALTGGLERRMEKMVRETVEPGVLQICKRLPEVLESQQRLSASLPQFAPYATLEAGDLDDCEKDVRSSFAAL